MLTQRRWLASTPTRCAGVQTRAPFDRGRVPDQPPDNPAHQREALPPPGDAVKDQRTGRGARPEREKYLASVAGRSVSLAPPVSAKPAGNSLAAPHHGEWQYLKRPAVTES
jgi:hypothetical protein